MKIAILTQPLGNNYGGIMQAYALQKVLRDLGHDVVTIDRQRDKRSLIKKILLPFKPVIYKLLGRRHPRKLTHEQNKYVYFGMTSFIRKNIQLSEPIYNSADLKAHYQENSYDLVIVGSDQVWRPKYSPNIYNFFGDFLKNDDKSISYAASFGVDEWEFDEEQTRQCKKLIQKFNAISVRESSAIELCKGNLGVEAELVLDPTLLVTADDYESLLSGRKSGGQGKVLKYILDESEQKKQLTEQVIQLLCKPLFNAQPIRSINDPSALDIEEYKYPTVESWIMSFRDADFVITDSFHGCVFSIIFNKPFIAIGNYERGLSRFESLLSLFGLSDRLIMDDEVSIKPLIDKGIDWESVNFKLAGYQEKSISFLNKCV